MYLLPSVVKGINNLRAALSLGNCSLHIHFYDLRTVGVYEPCYPCFFTCLPFLTNTPQVALCTSLPYSSQDFFSSCILLKAISTSRLSFQHFFFNTLRRETRSSWFKAANDCRDVSFVAGYSHSS